MSQRIGQSADQAGVSVQAVRYYERIGVLPKAARTSSGIRRYPPSAVDRIRFVKQAQRNGFSLAEIRELIGLTQRGPSRRCKQVLTLIAAKLKEIDQRRAQLKAFRRTLQTYAAECERSLRVSADPECPVIAKIGRP